MKPEVITISKPSQKPPNDIHTVPMVIPVIPENTGSSKKIVISVALTTILLCSVFAILFVFESKSKDTWLSFYEEEVDLLESDIWAENKKKNPSNHRKNFELQVECEGQRSIESVSADEDEGVVTIHSTGENGREIDTVVYDYNMGVVAVRDFNTSACFMMSQSSLPTLDLVGLEAASKADSVIEADQKVFFEISGQIPDGFLRTALDSVVLDLCTGVPSYWLQTTTRAPSRNKRQDKATAGTGGGVMTGWGASGGLLIGIPRADGTPAVMISFPAGGTATVVIITIGG